MCARVSTYRRIHTQVSPLFLKLLAYFSLAEVRKSVKAALARSFRKRKRKEKEKKKERKGKKTSARICLPRYPCVCTLSLMLSLTRSSGFRKFPRRFRSIASVANGRRHSPVSPPCFRNPTGVNRHTRGLYPSHPVENESFLSRHDDVRVDGNAEYIVDQIGEMEFHVDEEHEKRARDFCDFESVHPGNGYTGGDLRSKTVSRSNIARAEEARRSFYTSQFQNESSDNKRSLRCR